LPQRGLIVDVLDDVGVVLMTRAHHQVVFGEAGLLGKRHQLVQGLDVPVQALRGAVSESGDFQVLTGVDPKQQFGVPGHEAPKGV
jgi:hypothetical protein